MITREQKTRLGLFLLITILTLVATLALFLAPRFKDKGDDYLVRFRGVSVNGLNVGGSVKYQGVEIGRVSEIIVDPDDINAVLVRFWVRAFFPMKENMEAKLQYQGITGNRYLEISGGTTEAPRIRKGSEIPIGKGLSEQAEDMVSNVDTAVSQLNLLLQTRNLDRIARFLENLETSSQIINDTLLNQKGRINSAIHDLSDAGRQLNETGKNLQEVTRILKEGLGKVSLPDMLSRADRSLSHLEARLSERELGQTISGFNSLLGSADMTLKKMSTLFVSQQDELSRALQSLSTAMENLSRLTRELSEDPTSLIRTRKESRRKK
jgi:phospholipid/cholesterol/gamma-HCH transport system substrate-binding protein